MALTTSALRYIGGCALQLSDGTNVYLATDGATDPTITLRYWDGTTEHTIGTLTAGGSDSGGYDMTLGYQSMAMCRDAANNLYIVGLHGGTHNEIVAQAWKKGAGYTWTKQTALYQGVTQFTGGELNNFALVFHATKAGHLMCLYSHNPSGDDFVDQAGYAVLNCTALLTGSGTLFAQTKSASDAAMTWLSRGNGTAGGAGTGLDVISTGITGIGYFVGGTGTYTLNPDTGILHSQSRIVTNGRVVDADSKVRLLRINASKFAVVDGSTIKAYDTTGNLLGSVDIADGPAHIGTLTSDSDWDVIYDATSNKVWLIYIDSAATRSLRATDYSMTTYVAVGTDTLISSTVGASGSSNLSVRVPRGTVNEQIVRTAIANLASGTHSLVEQTVSFNLAPNAPALIPVDNYNATAAQVFSWKFTDPNTSDTQTAYQLQIIKTSDSSSAYDSGKVTSTVASKTLAGSTLTNGNDYQWRVRTYDTFDAVGPYSAYLSLSVSQGAVATITDPAEDNQDGINTSSYPVVWTVSGDAQATYKVTVTRTSDSTVIYNSGVQTSTNTTHTVTGMVSDTEYSISVILKNADNVGVASSPRLVTPSYTHPEVPTIELSTSDDASIQVAIANPAPTGDNPDAASNNVYRRPTGTEEWTLIANVERNGIYGDYAVAASTSYDYYVEAVATAGTTPSEIGSESVEFSGIWLHDPLDPDGTIYNYLYGTGKSDAVGITSASRAFAGRRFPVYSYGETQTGAISVTISVPHGPDWMSEVMQLEEIPVNRSTICYRDNRGRKAFGSVDAVNTADEDFGSTVTFTVNQIEYDESVA